MSNDTSNFEFDENNKTVEIVEIVYHTVAIVTGVPINFWAAFRYYKIWNSNPTKKRLVWLGANLTLANLMILLIHSPNQIIWLMTIDWRLDEAWCKTLMFLRVVAHHLSSNATVIIAVDMYCSFRRPFERRSKKTARSAMFYIATGAAAAVVCALPQLFTWGLKEIPGTEEKKMQCLFLYSDYLGAMIAYQFFHLATIFYVPLLIIVLCYCGSASYLWRYLKQRKTLVSERTKFITRSYSRKVKLSEQRSTTSNGSLISFNNGRIKRKLMKVSASVVLCYVVSWLPYQTVSLLDTGYMLTLPADQPVLLSEPWWYDYLIWLEALQISNACLNPILYSFHGL